MKMTTSVVTTGMGGATYRALFRKKILEAKPPVVGMAVAYVSVSGLGLVKSILEEGEVGAVRLVTDTKDGVTHPKALEGALNNGWDVRVVDSLLGTFHPKLYVGAASFDNKVGFSGITLAITGSANLSHNAFFRNGECSFWSREHDNLESVGQAWLRCWNVGVPLNEAGLKQYETYFAQRNRRRTPDDLLALGVTDSIPSTKQGHPAKGTSPPKPHLKAIAETAASVAWAGLQSFTGEYRLQVEFPKEAGLVLNRLFGEPAKAGTTDIVCADGIVRPFQYRYYQDNGMFRLNVPNDVPLVDWVRENKAGIARVDYDTNQEGYQFAILKPGPQLFEVVDRSLALGTWGRTSTRLYGWY